LKLTIDYASHPAFRTLSPETRVFADASRYFTAVDVIWAEIVSAAALNASRAGTEFDRKTQPILSDLKQALAGQRMPEDYLPFVSAALVKSQEAIRAEIVQVIRGRATTRAPDVEVERIVAQLQDHGAAAFRMDTPMRRAIVESLQPYYREVESQRDSGSGARCFVTIPARGTHWNILKSFVRDKRIEDAISAYAGFRLELSGYSLTLSHPGETWFKICYQDIGLAAPRTVQQHYDLDNLSAKSMFYLNEVDPDCGPFTYLPGSRSLIRWRSQTSFFKYLDYANNEFAASRESADTIYNRPLFCTPALRPAFAALPSDLQGSACPGDDVLDDSALSATLLEGERALTSDDGDLMLFAGGETLHRGGVARGGERYALQMIYSSPPGFAQQVKRLPRRLAGRIKRTLSRT